MTPKKSPNAISDAESELAGLQRRRSSLQARHDAAVTALESAKAARRELLVASDDPAPSKLGAADRAVREADDARVAAMDAGQEIETRIADVGARLASLIEAEQRDQRAAALEAAANAAEAAVVRLQKAAGEIEAARQALAEAIGPDAVELYAPPTTNPNMSHVTYLGKSWFDFLGNNTREIVPPMEAAAVAARIAGHILAPALPSCAITSDEEVAMSRKPMGPTQALCPVDDLVTARALIVDPMRAAAAQMRAAPAASA